jgi:hypothetical protein
MPSRRPTKHPQAASTYANHGAAWQLLDQHVEFDHVTQRYRAVTRCRCGGDRVWLTDSMVGLLDADRILP